MTAQHDSTFLTRVVIQNYRSIASCDVRLGPLTFLVGPNGSGKSNFLDALRFVSDALRQGPYEAARTRGSFMELFHHGYVRTDEFGIRLEFRLPGGIKGHYAFAIGVHDDNPTVRREECFVHHTTSDTTGAFWFRAEDGSVHTNAQVAPAVVAERLLLVAMSGLSAFYPVHDALSKMCFYNIAPEEMRGGTLSVGPPLMSGGENSASVLRRITQNSPDLKHYIEQYLSAINPNVEHVEAREVAIWDALEVQDRGGSSGEFRKFSAYGMSDGTLRALGILLALFQTRGLPGLYIPLIGIEEPETAIHPGALAVLLDAIRDACTDTQVLISSHSPDLLEDRDVSPDQILIVQMGEDGGTRVAGVDDVDHSVLAEHLYTAGELLRIGRLRPHNNRSANGLPPVDLFGMPKGQ